MSDSALVSPISCSVLFLSNMNHRKIYLVQYSQYSCEQVKLFLRVHNLTLGSIIRCHCDRTASELTGSVFNMSIIMESCLYISRLNDILYKNLYEHLQFTKTDGNGGT